MAPPAAARPAAAVASGAVLLRALLLGGLGIGLLLLPATAHAFLLPPSHAHRGGVLRSPVQHQHQHNSASPPSLRLWAYYINDTTTGAGGYNGYNPPPPPPTGGRVTLVGAGPGDPELLTVAAVKALGTAELVIADRLIPEEVLGLVKGELRIARKHPGCAEQAQREIYDWVREGVAQGRHVVRLKIGDPFLFGRGGEEVHEYRGFGVEPQIIPGVSSAFSAPLLAAIPVTHRGVANQVYICTGYGRDGDRPYLAPYYPNQTAVFLMAVGRLKELCQNLETVGYPTTTPVAIVERASTPRQRTLLGTVASIPELAEAEKAAAPAVVVVGEVVHVLLERGGPQVLHGAITGWVSEAEKDKEPVPLVEGAARGLVGGGMRGGAEGKASLPRRVVRGAVGWVRAVWAGRRDKGRRSEE